MSQAPLPQVAHSAASARERSSPWIIGPLTHLHALFSRERISAHFILHKKSTPDHAEGTIRITPYPIPPSPQEIGGKFPAGFEVPDDELRESFRKTAKGGDPKAGAKISRVAIAKEARGLGLCVKRQDVD